MPGVDLESTSYTPSPTNLPSLDSLEAALGRTGSNRFPLRHMVDASLRTLKDVRLGKVDPFVFAPRSTHFAFLLPVAPRLHRFEIFEESQLLRQNYLETLIDNLKEVRILKLGFNGYDPNTLFARLLRLPHLQLFSLHQSPTTSQEVIDLITAEGAAAFLSQAPKLREVHLPRFFFSQYWKAEEIVAVKAAAKEARVKLKAGL